MNPRLVLAFCLGSALGARVASAQERWVGRAELAMLNPADPLAVTLAFGLAVGRELDRHNSVYLRWTRQSEGENGGVDIGAGSRNYLGVSAEHAFGFRDIQTRQFSVRADAGVMLRPLGLPAGPYVGGGLVVHYALSERTAFALTLLDEVVYLPGVTLYACDPALQPNCTERVKGRPQNNFGVGIAFEVRR